MKQFFITAFVFALIAGLCPQARAELEDGAEIDDSIVVPLMAWVEHYTGVKSIVPPHVIASHKLLSTTVTKLKDQSASRRAVGAYTPGVVIIDERDWDPNDPIELSVLVHELVHHNQFFMAKNGDCHDAMENEAYTLQNKFLTDRGLAPFNDQEPGSFSLKCPGKQPKEDKSKS